MLRQPWIVLCVVLGVTTEASSRVTDKLVCRLDKKINADTFESYLGEIGNIFGAACGRNRGIFVIDPPDGHTYNCAGFPTKWNAKDANSVKQLEGSEAAPILNEFIKSVYMSSPQYVRARDPGACDFEAMSELVCGAELPWQSAPWAHKLNAPIRGANLGGLFVLKRWVTPSLFTDAWVSAGITDQESFSKKCATLGVCYKYQEHMDTFYTSADFVQMKLQGLNTVRVPVGYWLFESLTTNSPSGYILPQENILDFKHPLTKVVSMAMSVGLSVILDLEPVDPDSLTPAVDAGALTHSTAAAMGQYIKHLEDTFSLHNIILVEIGSDLGGLDGQVMLDAVGKLRASSPTMPVLVLEGSQLPQGQADVFINTKVYHGFSVPDVASDHPSQDREKLYAHEKIACGFKAPLHFTTCTRAPTLVGEFSLAIDNCMPGVDSDFKDYGQCSHLDSRVDSPWWAAHMHSFAMRQLDTYERELGWVFWSYKLDDLAETDPSAPTWSYRLAVRKGLLTPASYGTDSNNACDHYPKDDYILGDDTLAPTSSPTYWEPNVDVPPPELGASNDRRRQPTRRPTTYYIKPAKTTDKSKNTPKEREPTPGDPGYVDSPPGSLPDGQEPGFVPGVIPGYVPGAESPGDTDSADGRTSPVGQPVGGWDAPPNAGEWVPPGDSAPLQGHSRTSLPPSPSGSKAKAYTHAPSPSKSPRHSSRAPTPPTGGEFKDDNGNAVEPGGGLAPGQIPGEVPGVDPGQVPGINPGEMPPSDATWTSGHSAANGFVLLAVISSSVLATGGFYYWKYYASSTEYHTIGGEDVTTGAPTRHRPIHKGGGVEMTA